ncbi:alpha/beta hydrolase [Candidatus Saccharibacteria bacterium]|nr:MAG: alpha/beta hydrolase [Candidatus Saccharibacteria bacterium]
MILVMDTDRQLVEFGPKGKTLVGSFSSPKGGETGKPIVVLLTGDGPNGSNSQTWRQFVPMLNKAGLNTFLFDFAGLGNSDGDYKTLTLTRGCDDFKRAMEFILSNGSYDRSRIGLIGSSFGGNVALLCAADFDEVKAIGLKSASTFLPEGYQIENGAELMEDWARTGFSEAIGHTYDIVEDSLFHNTYERASKIKCPVRIVHGTADSSVPIRHARDLLCVLPNGSMLEIPGADHWYAEGNEWNQMAKNITAFMSSKLL